MTDRVTGDSPVTVYVLALAPEETEWLTIAEWDALTARSIVLFERGDHPLMQRLRGEGVAVEPLAETPRADLDVSVVVDPWSNRLVELARAGAEVSSATAVVPDALTAAHAAPITRRASAALGRLAAIMARLRSEDGCPWDLQQSHVTLKPHLLEEAYEVIDAIERGSTGAELEEELGDLLLQVVFHAQLASDEERFDLAGVADRISAKLVRRHPHVFGDVTVGGADEVVANWEAIKTEEKERAGPFDDIPAALPALIAAQKTQKRAASLGFSSDEVAATRHARAALDAKDVGEALFWLVALARAAGLDPEGALREATTRFRSSFS